MFIYLLKSLMEKLYMIFQKDQEHLLMKKERILYYKEGVLVDRSKKELSINYLKIKNLIRVYIKFIFIQMNIKLVGRIFNKITMFFTTKY